MKAFLRYALPLILLPLLALVGIFTGSGRHWIALSAGMCLCALLLFYARAEHHRVRSRRTVITAVLTALSTIGRFVPLIKPTTAMTVIGGIYLGSEAGFLIGSFSALLSNFAFGQGPWTPFQMLSWGLIGFFAGKCGKLLTKHPLLLHLYGALSGIAYSMVMDVFTVVWGSGTMTPALYLSALLTAIPHTLLYVGSNLVFLLVLARPMGEKLERIKRKYGI